MRRSFSAPQWFGAEPIRGKTILLHAEQGLGDTLQFVRYVSRVAAQGARVVLEVQPALKDLISGIEGPAEVIARGEDLPEFDIHCPLLSLPLAFGTRLDTIPADIPYLTVPPDRITAWSSHLERSALHRVGLAWSGGRTHRNDHNRSIALTHLAPLFADPQIQFVSLQQELRDGDLEILQANPQIVHFGDELHDFADTAAVVSELDVVISVDTSVAHLAGALGKPVWILLPFAPDWRWLLDRKDSPWYPTARLFRQPKIADWDGVIECVRQELSVIASRD